VSAFFGAACCLGDGRLAVPARPQAARGAILRVREVYAATLRVCGQRAGSLLLIGAVVFVPLGLLDAVPDQVVEVGSLSDLSDLATFALLIAVLAQSVTVLLGEVFYSGAVALLIARTQPGERHSLLGVARSLSYGRLIAVDLLFGLGIAVGLVLFVVPGVVAFTWFALAGPLVELDGVGVGAAFARSRRLVRGHFWTVLAVLGPITLASEALTNAALTAAHHVLGDSLLADWLGESATNIVLSPLYAVAAVLMTLQLSERLRSDRQ
jgi:hypothetical protein